MWEQFGAYRFRVLLASILLMILVFPTMDGSWPGRVVFDGMLVVVFLAGIATIFHARRLRTAALLAGVPSVVVPWVAHVWGQEMTRELAVATHCGAALFMGCALAATVFTVYREEGITADGICGALCGYLLLALAFGHVYCALEVANPGSFRVHGAPLEPLERGGRTHFLLVYFSLVTLTTVGYGDMSPASPPARGFAVVQAVLGQFYLAVLLADLVGKRVAQVTARGDDDRAARGG